MLNRLLLKHVLATCAGIWLSLLVTAGPVPTNKPAAYPDWWFTQDVIPVRPEFSALTPTTNPPLRWPDHYQLSDDYAVANLGQLKHIAIAADVAFDASLPDQSGAVIDALVGPWKVYPAPGSPTRDDFVALNLGQLKAVAKPFYDQLYKLNYIGQPFTSAQSLTSDFP
jgi:hypothetical protein